MKKIFSFIKKELEALCQIIYHRTRVGPIVNQFHELYYNSHVFGKSWANTFWLGVPTLKCPLDLWVYQEIIFEIKPDLIIECGTASGGERFIFSFDV